MTRAALDNHPKRESNDRQRPYDNNGRFVHLDCPLPTCDGKLVYVGDGIWGCDGLVDPEDENKELEACRFAHIDGRPYGS